MELPEKAISKPILGMQWVEQAAAAESGAKTVKMGGMEAQEPAL